MFITYNEFCDLVYRADMNGEDFYDSLLINIMDNPSRYSGLFRLSNAKTKLMQNVTQSKEIKFGEIIEQLTTDYLDALGYNNLDKSLGRNRDGDELKVDQLFLDNANNIHMVEMKIRDDHDSTKKRGQFLNFKKKIEFIRERYPNKHIIAVMWFVDDTMKKNKKFYTEQILNTSYYNCELNIYYGRDFFLTLNRGEEAWNELEQLLREYRLNHIETVVTVPDFGNSREILDALIRLEKKYWNRLISNKPKFILLREELFRSGNNIELARAEREKLNR